MTSRLGRKLRLSWLELQWPMRASSEFEDSMHLLASPGTCQRTLSPLVGGRLVQRANAALPLPWRRVWVTILLRAVIIRICSLGILFFVLLLLLLPSMLQCKGRHPLSLECFVAFNRFVTMDSRAAACLLVLNDNMACCSSAQPAYVDIIGLLMQSARCGAGGAGKVQGWISSLRPCARSDVDGKADCRTCIQVMPLCLCVL